MNTAVPLYHGGYRGTVIFFVEGNYSAAGLVTFRQS